MSMYEYIHACTYACMNVELAGVLCSMIDRLSFAPGGQWFQTGMYVIGLLRHNI